MKTCFICNVQKELSEFYKHKMMADGHLGKCKECTKAYVKNRRREMPEHVREIDNKRSTKEARKKKMYQYTVKKRALYPEKNRARRMVGVAVRTGYLIRPAKCERCEETKVEAHHPDYSKPLDVMWLCRRCHRREHGTLVN